MARRPPEAIVCTVIDREVHAQLIAYKRLIRARTISDAVMHALNVSLSRPVSDLLAAAEVDARAQSV